MGRSREEGQQEFESAQEKQLGQVKSVQNVRQNDIRMRAALSHSLSRVVGAYDSPFPVFDDAVLNLLPEAGIRSAHPRTLSRLFFPLLLEPALFLLRSHDGSKADTRCILLQKAGLPPGG